MWKGGSKLIDNIRAECFALFYYTETLYIYSNLFLNYQNHCAENFINQLFLKLLFFMETAIDQYYTSFISFLVSCKGIYKKFQGSFKGVSRKLQECFKEVSGKFQGFFKKVSWVFQLRLKGDSRSF